MTVVFDIGHPAHVHYFKHMITQLQDNKHRVIVFARDKECAHELLRAYDIPFISRGKGSNSFIGKLLYILKTDAKFVFKLMTKKVDVFVGFASPYAAHAAWILRKKSLTIDDTDRAHLSHRLYKPFTSVIATPQVFEKDLGLKQVRFDSFMELCYLHPSVFKPNPEVLIKLGLQPEDRFVILRFVSWGANHDWGQRGLSLELKRELIQGLLPNYKVFISSEGELPEEFAAYQLKIPSEDLHDVLSFASLYIGEGATMAAEAALLGVPAVYTNSLNAGTLNRLKSAGLLYMWEGQDDDFLSFIETLTSNTRLHEEHQNMRKKLLSETMNPLAFFQEIIHKNKA
jgi:predicted glycosyltransferase